MPPRSGCYLIFTTEAYCCRVHNLGKQESNLAGTGRPGYACSPRSKSFVYRSEAELPVEQNDVVGVDLRTRR